MQSSLRCCRGVLLVLSYHVLLDARIDALLVHVPTSSSNRQSVALGAHSLTTCLESLSLERRDSEEFYQYLSWIDLSHNKVREDDTENSGASIRMTMPLYPLGAVYMPTRNISNHTLVNVEPQNVQMALDLLGQAIHEGPTCNTDPANRPRFCAVLRAMDTGRIASIGTVMSIIEAEKQYHYGTEDIARIRLTCRAEELVQIFRVENGEEWSTKRIMKSREYLKATVKPIQSSEYAPSDNTSPLQEEVSKLAKDLKTIKTMYQLDLGAEDFPPDTLPKLGEAIQDIAVEMTEIDKDSRQFWDDLENDFWRIAQEWQSICYTLRQGQQSLLSAERNELMVEAACAKGGPLQLPIHMEDLQPQYRELVQRLEREAQQKHIELGMDAVLDFQVLISLADTAKRIEWLNRLMTRERLRLEKIVSLQFAQ